MKHKFNNHDGVRSNILQSNDFDALLKTKFYQL